MSSRRFLAQQPSAWSLHIGFSSPRLTDSIWPSLAPSRISARFTVSERRWPRPPLYSRLPRSSALPWMSIFAAGFSRRYLACASTRPLYSDWISNLSYSKKICRFERMLFGSLSIAEGSARREVRSTVGAGLRAVASGAGAAAASGLAAGLSASPVVLHAANSATRLVAAMIGRILVLMVFPPLSLLIDERPPGRLAYVACRRGQALFDTTVGGDRREHAAAVDDRGEQNHPAVRGEAR